MKMRGPFSIYTIITQGRVLSKTKTKIMQGRVKGYINI